MRFFALALVLLAIAPSPPPSRYLVSWAMESRTYPADGIGHDFLAVFDIGDPANFGRLVSMLPVPTHAQMAHHTNYVMPPNHLLFANDFMAGKSYIFDLRDPRKPSIEASFDAAGPYAHPHSFAYLTNGHVLATYQFKGNAGDVAGALVELDSKGHVLRMSDAAAPQLDPYIRPYSVLVLESLDRVVTTSAPMPPFATKEPTRSVQVWRLSDLKLLKTVVLPKPARFNGVAGQDSDEAALLSDGKTVLVKTATCGLYRLDDLDGTNPDARFVYDFGYRVCGGVPIVVADYWVEPCLSGHAIVSLDVRDPSHPVEASHLMLGSEAYPHWLALEPGTNRFVITGFGSLLNRISFASVDPQTGSLALDDRFIDFNRKWPDGWDGPAIPHATLFY